MLKICSLFPVSTTGRVDRSLEGFTLVASSLKFGGIFQRSIRMKSTPYFGVHSRHFDRDHCWSEMSGVQKFDANLSQPLMAFTRENVQFLRLKFGRPDLKIYQKCRDIRWTRSEWIGGERET